MGSSNSAFPGHGPKDMSYLSYETISRAEKAERTQGMRDVFRKGTPVRRHSHPPPPHSPLLLPHHHRAVSRRDPTHAHPLHAHPMQPSSGKIRPNRDSSSDEKQKSPHLILHELEGGQVSAADRTPAGSREEDGTRAPGAGMASACTAGCSSQ